MGAYRITERSCKQYYKSQSKEKSQIKQKEHLALRCSFCSAIDRRVRVLQFIYQGGVVERQDGQPVNCCCVSTSTIETH